MCSRVAEQDSLCLSVQEGVGLLTTETCAKAYEQREYTAQRLELRGHQCGVLADKVCADLPGRTRFCRTVRDRVLRYTPDFCVDMLRKYPQTLQELKQQLAANQLKPEDAARLYAGDPPAWGPQDAPIQIVEFIDYESAYSPKTASIMRNLAAKYATRLHFVIRQLPLPDNPHAQLAAQAALAAHAQGKYWEMHDRLLENRTQLDRASLLRYARELGLDAAKFKAALDQRSYAAAVDADIALAKSLQLVGMPILFVNNERILNSIDEADITAAIEEQLALAQHAR